MGSFWRYAWRMLVFKRLLAIGLGAALVDAVATFAGFGTLLWAIDQFFGEGRTVRAMADHVLSDERVVRYAGDWGQIAELIPSSREGGLALLLGVIFAMACVGACARYVYHASMIGVVLRTIMRLRKDGFQRLVHVPVERLMGLNTADFLSRVVRDTNQLGQGFQALMGRAIRDVLMGLVFLTLALVVDWGLSLLFVVGLAAVFVVVKKLGKRIRKASRRAARAYGRMTGTLQDVLQGMSTVKVHNAEGYERRRFNTVNRWVLKQEMRARRAKALASPLIELISLTGIIVITMIAAWIVLGDEGRAPVDLLKVLGLLAMAGNSLRPLANLNNKIQVSAAAAERVDDVMDLPVESVARGLVGGGEVLPRHHREIRFEGVSYAYPGERGYALRGVDLRVGHGESVALVGPNGSGKSTLLYLVPRLLEPSEGRVVVDGHDVAGVDLRSLRRQIAYVSQQTTLFEGTIAENIAYGMRHIGLDRIEGAARQADAHEFIEAMPAGYGTHLGEGGAGLSGGQRQRLALARAILRDPAILILDEATSQVDVDSEQRINEVLERFTAERTTLVVAHRVSTVLRADRVAVFEQGELVDVGGHDELARRCGTYQSLAQTQLSG